MNSLSRRPVQSHQPAVTAEVASFDSHNRRKWEYQNRVYQGVLARYVDAVHAILTDTGAAQVFDAGCGEGFVFRALRARGYGGTWSGVDSSEGAIEYARGASAGTDSSWSVGNLYALTEPDRRHELVLCSQVLEHLPAPENALAELTRVSRRWLLVSVPVEPVFRAICAVTVAARIGRDPGHVNFWSPRAFRAFLKPAGRLVRWTRSSVYQIALVDTTAR